MVCPMPDLLTPGALPDRLLNRKQHPHARFFAVHAEAGEPCIDRNVIRAVFALDNAGSGEPVVQHHSAVESGRLAVRGHQVAAEIVDSYAANLTTANLQKGGTKGQTSGWKRPIQMRMSKAGKPARKQGGRGKAVGRGLSIERVPSCGRWVA